MDNSRFQPIPNVASSQWRSLPKDVPVTTIGFGTTSPTGGNVFPDVLQEADQPIWFDGDCKIVWGAQATPFNVDEDIELCAGGRPTQEASVFVSSPDILVTL